MFAVGLFGFELIPPAALLMDPAWRLPDDGLDALSLISVKIAIVTTLNCVAAFIAWYS